MTNVAINFEVSPTKNNFTIKNDLMILRQLEKVYQLKDVINDGKEVYRKEIVKNFNKTIY